jgi:hypothetical protein
MHDEVWDFPCTGVTLGRNVCVVTGVCLCIHRIVRLVHTYIGVTSAVLWGMYVQGKESIIRFDMAGFGGYLPKAYAASDLII